MHHTTPVEQVAQVVSTNGVPVARHPDSLGVFNPRAHGTHGIEKPFIRTVTFYIQVPGIDYSPFPNIPDLETFLIGGGRWLRARTGRRTPGDPKEQRDYCKAYD